MRRLLPAFAMALCLLSVQAAQACERSVRWEDDPPYSMPGPDGEPTGLGAELIRAALDRLGCRAQWVKVPWARALVMLERGQLDMIEGATYTPEREAYARFSRPTLHARNILFIRRGDEGKWPAATLSDLAGSTIRLGVMIDVVYSQEFDALSKQPSFRELLVEASRNELLWRMLSGNRVDAIIGDEYTGHYMARKLGVEGAIIPHGLIISQEPSHVVFSRKSVDADWVFRFDAAIEGMRADGTYDRILAKYRGVAPIVERRADQGAD